MDRATIDGIELADRSTSRPHLQPRRLRRQWAAGRAGHRRPARRSRPVADAPCRDRAGPRRRPLVERQNRSGSRPSTSPRRCGRWPCSNRPGRRRTHRRQTAQSNPPGMASSARSSLRSSGGRSPRPMPPGSPSRCSPCSAQRARRRSSSGASCCWPGCRTSSRPARRDAPAPRRAAAPDGRGSDRVLRSSPAPDVVAGRRRVDA